MTQRHPATGDLQVWNQIGAVAFDFLDPARVSPSISRRAINDCRADLDLARGWHDRPFGVDRRPGSPGAFGPMALQCRDRDLGAVAIAIGYQPNQGALLAAGIPGRAADLRQFFGDDFDLLFAHDHLPAPDSVAAGWGLVGPDSTASFLPF